MIQKLLASGQIPATLAMQIAAAKNDPEKLKEIAKGLTRGPRWAGAGLSRSQSRR